MSVTFMAMNPDITDTFTGDSGIPLHFPKKLGSGPSFANQNARMVLENCGYTPGDDIRGEIEIHEFCRNAIMAINHGLSGRAEVIEYGKPRENEDGTTELKPLRFLCCGLTEEGLKDRIHRVMEFAVESAMNGATHIYWA